jgi:hypothetical protein
MVLRICIAWNLPVIEKDGANLQEVIATLKTA